MTDEMAASARGGHGLVRLLTELFHHLRPVRKRQFYLLLVLMVIGAFAELAAIGAVLPFLSLLANPEQAYKIDLLAEFFKAIGADSPDRLLIAATALFGVAAIGAGAVRLLLAWASQKFVFLIGHEFGVDIHRRILHQPYSYHVAHNSSHVLAAMEKVHLLVIGVLLPLMLAATAVLISIFIGAILIYIDPTTALIAAGGFCFVYVLVSWATHNRLKLNSDIINAALAQRVQAIQESLGGIRDIIIDQSQPIYVEQFQRLDYRYRTAQANSVFIAAAPRFVIEAGGMVLIALLAWMLAGREGGLATAIPVLGALALGAQRLLPLLQQVYYGWVQVAGNRDSLIDVIEKLRLPGPDAGQQGGGNAVPFAEQIRFENVGFSYSKRDHKVVSGINLEIVKGSRVALIGKTGSGKSTLIDLLMGLLEPDEGRITVDGRPLTKANRQRWQRQIAHVPQSIFLADTTIERNIAFGSTEGQVDRKRVEAAALQAQLHDFIAQLPEGYDTEVGERGVRLSGGQRQRLGIARALYKAAPVLILDEATSALDDETEAAVMQSLQGLDEKLTVIMIAHRLTTIVECDQVVRMDKGKISDVGTYAEIFAATRCENI